MDHLLQEALCMAITSNKSSFDFYRSAAAKVCDGSVRRLFERLADTKARQVDFPLGISPDPESRDLKIPLANHLYPNRQQQQVLLTDMAEFTGEKEALELALQEEAVCSEHYSVLVEAIRESAVHAVLRLALNEAHRHAEVLKEEYLQINERGWHGRPDQLCADGDLL